MVDRVEGGLRGGWAMAALLDYYAAVPDGTTFIIQEGCEEARPEVRLLIMRLGEVVIGLTAAEAVTMAGSLETAAKRSAASADVFTSGGFDILAEALRAGAAKLEITH